MSLENEKTIFVHFRGHMQHISLLLSAIVELKEEPEDVFLEALRFG